MKEFSVESPFARHIRAAEGYIELGMPLEANAELECVAPELRHTSEVLAVRARIYAKLEKWELLQVVARQLALREPDNAEFQILWADSARKADCVESARRILVAAMDRLPPNARVLYHLACYEVLLGDLDAAKGRLRQTIALDPALRQRALDDGDMKGLWDSL